MWISLVVRFLDKQLRVREELDGFLLCISGKAISGYIKDALRSFGLDLNKCKGQEYDGAGNMSGKYI